MGRQTVISQSKKLYLVKDTLYRRGRGSCMHPRQPKFVIMADKSMNSDEFDHVCQLVDPDRNRTTSGRKIVYKNRTDAEADWAMLVLMFA